MLTGTSDFSGAACAWSKSATDHDFHLVELGGSRVHSRPQVPPRQFDML
jgi:hypothetical protein